MATYFSLNKGKGTHSSLASMGKVSFVPVSIIKESNSLFVRSIKTLAMSWIDGIRGRNCRKYSRVGEREDTETRKQRQMTEEATTEYRLSSGCITTISCNMRVRSLVWTDMKKRSMVPVDIGHDPPLQMMTSLPDALNAISRSVST
jgi:hypothetical protein